MSVKAKLSIATLLFICYAVLFWAWLDNRHVKVCVGDVWVFCIENPFKKDCYEHTIIDYRDGYVKTSDGLFGVDRKGWFVNNKTLKSRGDGECHY